MYEGTWDTQKREDTKRVCQPTDEGLATFAELEGGFPLVEEGEADQLSPAIILEAIRRRRASAPGYTSVMSASGGAGGGAWTARTGCARAAEPCREFDASS
jgi:hypothetical protein